MATDHAHDDHDAHDAHDEHPHEDPRWVLAPVVAGLVIGVVVAAVLGLESGAAPFHLL